MDATELGRLPRSYEVTPAGLFLAWRAAIQMKATAASALGSQPVRPPEHDTHVHWIHGGTTDLDNLVLLCRRHHRMVHEGGWQLVKCEDSQIVTIAPSSPFMGKSPP